MDPRQSLQVYPRIDQVYKTKKSLNYDAMRTKIMQDREHKKREGLFDWLAYFILAILVAFVASLMVELEESLTDVKKDQANDIIDGNSNNLAKAWSFFTFFSVGLALVAALLTVFIGPGAAGSGVAELIGYLNGVNYPNVFGGRTVTVKAVGVVLAVVAGLCVGKEGPLAHIGANLALITLYMPIPGFELFRNDVHKRQLIAAGTSCGVSVAFGAPIGGTLFAYEISTPNTFWKFTVIWKTFFACALSTFLLGLFEAIYTGEELMVYNSSVLKFGTVNTTNATLETIPGSIIVGLICGFLGALFIEVNTYFGYFRKKYIQKPYLKVLEVCFFSFMTTTTFFWVPKLFKCAPVYEVAEDSRDLLVQYDCPDGEYSPIGSLLFNTEGATIRTLLAGFSTSNIELDLNQMYAFFGCWYIWTITTYGCTVPAGLFLPGIILGCTVGAIYELTRANLYDLQHDTLSQIPIICGAGAMLSSYTRMTYSLVVIMLETTQSINMFIPQMTAIMAARVVASQFTRSLYERALRTKQIPLLQVDIPEQNKNVRACTMMARDLLTCESITSVAALRPLMDSKHNAFPVLNTNNKLVGLIHRDFLCILLEQKAFYTKKDGVQSNSVIDISGQNMNASAETDNENAIENIDLNPMNRSDFSVNLSKMNTITSNLEDSFTVDYDQQQGYPETTQEEQVDWTKFNTDFYSNEKELSIYALSTLKDCGDSLIDLRPYMIKRPFKVVTTDFMERVLELFRHHHLRHLPVVTPGNGDLVGIITRQDVFQYMHL